MVRAFPFSHSFNDPAFGRYYESYQAVVRVEAAAAAAKPIERLSNNIPPPLLVCRETQPSHHVGIFIGPKPLQYSITLVFVEIVVVILITRIVRFLLKPLKQPRVISEVIGGIFIGPSIIGRNKRFTHVLFPDNATFVIRNIGVLGFCFFLFISGVKMDLSIVKKSGKKQFYAAVVSITVPTILAVIVGLILRKSMDKELSKFSSIGAVSTSAALTAFHVIYPILKELNLLSSEVGRTALQLAIISDAIGLNAIIAFEAAKQAEVQSKAALWYMVSTFVFGAFAVTVVRGALIWIVKNTPEGKPVDQNYIVAILLGVFVMAFLADMFGIAIANGPLLLGLIVPDGPPLGATLVERSESIIMEIIMPFTFAFVGLYTDVHAMSAVGWSSLAPLFAIAVTGYVTKIIATFIATLFFNTSLRDGLTLSLIMSLRGQMEYLVFVHWIDKKIVQLPGFTLMVLLATASTAICVPLISILYDPTRPYMVNKRRTIQHTPNNAELRLVLCIYEQESIAGLIDLLEVSYPTPTNPFHVYILRLIELIGRATPLVIDHKKHGHEHLRYKLDETMQNALKLYQEARGEFVELNVFTAVSPKRTMYQDICELALIKKAAIIILPFNSGSFDNNIARTDVNSNVLAHAPCSVGIFVDRSQNPVIASDSLQNVMVLFLGGADAREALAFADRLTLNPEVESLTVVRFLSHNQEGDDKIEKKLDDGVVTSFWVRNEANERVTYREVVVNNGLETVAAIQAMTDRSFDLWIMGRKQGINPMLLDGLTNWSENVNELGVIGDMVASDDFGSEGSVLVIQQQILRDQGTTTNITTPPPPPTHTGLLERGRRLSSRLLSKFLN